MPGYHGPEVAGELTQSWFSWYHHPNPSKSLCVSVCLCISASLFFSFSHGLSLSYQLDPISPYGSTFPTLLKVLYFNRKFCYVAQGDLEFDSPDSASHYAPTTPNSSPNVISLLSWASQKHSGIVSPRTDLSLLFSSNITFLFLKLSLPVPSGD